jgi:hypothetical protein
MRRRTAILACWCLSAAVLGAACRADPTPGVTEISLRSGGGQTSYWYEITLRADGTARYIGDVSPERRREARTSKMMAENPERVRFRGKVSAEQFLSLSRLKSGTTSAPCPKDSPAIWTRR